MFFTDSVFVGIDPTSSHRSFTFAALDKGLNLLALGDGELDEVAAFLAGQFAALAAINAPSAPNRGLVREKKKELFKSLQSRAIGFRLADFELRERGIAVSGAPGTVRACPAWMQAGFTLYRKLEKMGFKKYPAANETFQLMETHPHAAFCVLLETPPLSKSSIEGKIQRQLLLYEAGVRINDPMDFFEEITRHKMLKGVWPTELLYQPEQLDAMIAAYTAWLAFYKPEKISTLGDAREGQIVLPASALKEKY
ncbi:MAG: DUF429 domain-containing protein [Chloroflexi bacterium]|nr:DUF429 domain-containing protein [Chloroflexota bacterium]